MGRASNAYFREYFKKRYADKRALAVALLGDKCSRCGSTERLEFHHPDPTTKTYYSGTWNSMSDARLREEVSNCVLLCKECHEKESIKQAGKQVAKGTHGTLSSYRYCKCSQCREAKRLWQIKYKQRPVAK